MLKAILLPVDLAETEGSRRALEFAVQLARSNGATLHVMTVLPNFGMSIVGSYFDKGFEQKALADIEQKIRAYCAAEIPSDIAVKPHVAHGAIYDEIMRGAEKLGCDAIVMGARGLGDLRAAVLGSVSHAVVEHSPVPVTVVRLPEE